MLIVCRKFRASVKNATKRDNDSYGRRWHVEDKESAVVPAILALERLWQLKRLRHQNLGVFALPTFCHWSAVVYKYLKHFLQLWLSKAFFGLSIACRGLSTCFRLSTILVLLFLSFSVLAKKSVANWRCATISTICDANEDDGPFVLAWA